ncbi:hypothetical protein ALC152_13060 [Arcobacter sp. 15-2]|uniref:hypothetical protein n=1 Tax=Arcobacter sp. 15-2 TaxID=3374109 RepID=UPI00399D46C4
MKFIILFITPIVIYAQTYMAKIEPYDMFTIYAQTSGQVIALDKNDETKIVNSVLIQLDDSLEKQKLKIYQNQLSMYNKKLSILNENYKKFVKIRGKSKSDKDDKYYVILELEVTIESLKILITELQDTINKKSIAVNDLYIKEFLVNKGDYVSIGTALASTYDVSKSKLIVYVSNDDYQDIRNKKILINGKDSRVKIDKVDKVLDATYVSAHKVTLVLDSTEYGKVLKVEFIK